MEQLPKIEHHGAVNGVTGSCHKLWLDNSNSILIDCGLFQGHEESNDGARAADLAIEFPIEQVRALIVTHVHIDHVGRIPYLLAAGFRGPIYCSQPSAVLLPLVLEDALKIGVTKERALIEKFLEQIGEQIVSVPYNQWIALRTPARCTAKFRMQPAGHIMGSAYVECNLAYSSHEKRVVFSGDLGATDTPLLPEPQPPHKADILVIESTYGDKNHESRANRIKRLKAVIKKAFADGGVILIPAFSIGRTQELIYELEELIHQHSNEHINQDLRWKRLPIIVDSPLAAQFTHVYRKLQPFWDQEARSKLSGYRHPLEFDQLITIDSYRAHLELVNRLKTTDEPCIVLAASGMCSGGRIVNYLKALIEEPTSDILFVGYQANGTLGRDIQRYGPRAGYVVIDGERFDIRAKVHTIGGYSAHADQNDLLNFIRGIANMPEEVRIVHGETEAKMEFKSKVEQLANSAESTSSVIIPTD